jgi:RNA polymerase sigma factor (TIGR02999 family)
MSAATFDAFTLTQMCLINDRCNRFEAVWQAGGRPEIKDFLTGLDPDAREGVLAELLAIEAEYLDAVRISHGTGREANRTNMWHDGGNWVTMARAVPRPMSLRCEPLPAGPPAVGPLQGARMSTHVTNLLEAAAGGDRLAAAAVLPLVYDELRTLAAARMAAEPVGHTLDATALVHEAYVRLVGPGDRERWQNRGHFFAAAAEAMRRILIESARRKGRRKRGGDRRRIALPFSAPAAELAPEDLIDLDEALVALAAEDPAKAELVELRSFGGLSVEEAAACLGISRATADRYWTYARAWLFDRLRDAAEPG